MGWPSEWAAGWHEGILWVQDSLPPVTSTCHLSPPTPAAALCLPPATPRLPPPAPAAASPVGAGLPKLKIEECAARQQAHIDSGRQVWEGAPWLPGDTSGDASLRLALPVPPVGSRPVPGSWRTSWLPSAPLLICFPYCTAVAAWRWCLHGLLCTAGDCGCEQVRRGRDRPRRRHGRAQDRQHGGAPESAGAAAGGRVGGLRSSWGVPGGGGAGGGSGRRVRHCCASPPTPGVFLLFSPPLLALCSFVHHSADRLGNSCSGLATASQHQTPLVSSPPPTC